jgi:hypothetical protein
MTKAFINFKNKTKLFLLDEINGLLFIWLISCSLIYIWIKSWGFQLDVLWNAVWGIFGTLISTIVLIFVIESYKIQSKAFSLQENELEKTRVVLQSQEEAIKEQKIQSLVIELLKMSDKHLIDFEKFLIGIYTWWSTSWLFKSYIANGNDLENHYDQKLLSPLLSYFKTLKYIEELIINTYPDENNTIKDRMISLVKNQINLDIIKAYPKLKLHDPDFITFDYLFSWSAFPEIFPNN